MCKPQSLHSRYSENSSCHPHCFLLYKLNLAVSYFSWFSPLYFTTSEEWSMRSMESPSPFVCVWVHVRSMVHISTHKVCDHYQQNCSKLSCPQELYISLSMDSALHQRAEWIGHTSYKWKREQGLRSRVALGLCKSRSAWGTSLLRI